jgi:hypothetical protein
VGHLKKASTVQIARLHATIRRLLQARPLICFAEHLTWKAAFYLVGPGKDGKWNGRWLVGGRRPAPWVGYGEVAGEDVDEA